MGASRDLIDAAALAPSGFEAWGDEVSSRADGSGAVSATAEGMDPSNSAAANTSAFNAAITKAGRNGKVVFDLSGTYQINAAIDLPYAGLTIEGSNHTFVRIQQVTANAHGFRLIPDATYDFTNAIGVTIRGIRIIGPGAGTTGVGIWSDPASGTYQGAKLTLEDVRVDSFDIGVRLHRFDNSYVHDLHLQSCRIGWLSSGNANSIHIINGTASTCSECCYSFSDGNGVTFHPGDLINSAKHIRVFNGGKVTIIGGNFESLTGSEGHIDIEANSHVVAIGNRFLKGSVEQPAYRVALASLVAIAPIMVNFTTAAYVLRATDTAVTHVISPSANLSNAERLMRMSDGTTYAHALFPSRIDNSVPAAASQYRGMVLQKVVRDAITAEDALYWYGKDRSSAADVYTQRVMTNVIEGTGSPESVVTARVGTLFARRDGGTDTSLYVKSSGTGNTGWRAVTTAAA